MAEIMKNQTTKVGFQKNENQRPLVGLGVLVMNDGKILLGKRKGSHGADEWCFPGGHLEFGESFEECAVREVCEETGLKVQNPRFFCISNDLNEIESYAKHYITLFMQVEYINGEPRVMEPEKCIQWGWFAFDSLPDKLFGPTQAAIKCLKNNEVYLPTEKK